VCAGAGFFRRPQRRRAAADSNLAGNTALESTATAATPRGKRLRRNLDSDGRRTGRRDIGDGRGKSSAGVCNRPQTSCKRVEIPSGCEGWGCRQVSEDRREPFESLTAQQTSIRKKPPFHHDRLVTNRPLHPSLQHSPEAE